MKKAVNFIGILFVSVFAFLIILKPEICIKSTVSGVLLCGNVIIPSIFPFTFCVLFINQSGVLNYLKPIDRITKWVFSLNFYEFSLFLLSLIGGYPLGARLLSHSKTETKKSATMINYCINAGPAFVVLAVGKGVFKSTTVGWILFFAHVISSVIIALILGHFFKNAAPAPVIKSLGIVNNFVTSASAAAETVIKICALVILFSSIGSYIEFMSAHFKPLATAALLLEVTNAVFKCDNVITVSFLLGFSGISIWCQVLTLLRDVKINYLKFVIFRIIHGVLSAGITFMLLKILKISISTFSNNRNFNFSLFTSGPTVAFSLLIMGIVLIISLYNKKYAGNLIEDIV